MIHSEPIILAIEAAIAGGSLSLLREGVEIANWIGTSNVAKAENLLVDIDRLLTENGLVVRDIGLVAVSAGPGSFTGIRIGIATALGLTTGLGIDMASESALKAMARAIDGEGNVITAVPAGRDTVCYQEFDINSEKLVEKDEPKTEREDVFLRSIVMEKSKIFALHQDLYLKTDTAPNIKDLGRNIAFSIGEACSLEPHLQHKPMFISKSS